jgi:lipid A 4'-phosphatase
MDVPLFNLKRCLWLWGGLALLFTLPFWVVPVDIWASHFFYIPAHAWPVADAGLVRFCEKLGPVLAGGWMAAGLVLFLMAFLQRAARSLWRVGAFMCLALVLGPGLVVNGIFKDHAGRYRPRQVVELGGTHAYQPPLAFAKTQGRSFPCGHSSVGFLFGTLALVLGARKKILKVAVVLASLVLGGALGAARMAAGAHFFSDVLWSALMVWVVADVCFYAIYHMSEEPWKKLWSHACFRWEMATIWVVLVGGLVVGLLASTPFDMSLWGTLPAAQLPQTLVVCVPAASVQVEETAAGGGLSYAGRFKGFGFPRSRVLVDLLDASGSKDALCFRENGLFTDLEGTLVLRVGVGALKRIVIEGASDVSPSSGVLPSGAEIVVK